MAWEKSMPVMMRSSKLSRNRAGAMDAMKPRTSSSVSGGLRGLPEDAADAQRGGDAGLDVDVGRVVLDGETEELWEVHTSRLV